MKFDHINDLTGKPCRIVREQERTELIAAGVVPSSKLLVVADENGKLELIFPWEVSKIES